MNFQLPDERMIAYQVCGPETAPLVVLAHPLGMNQSVWDDLVESLMVDYRVLTWDLPGHGNSTSWSPQTEMISVDVLCDDLLAIVDSLGVESFHFIGTSIGGLIGQRLLSKNREQLLSITLTNTGAVIGTEQAWQERANNVRDHGLQKLATNFVPRWFSKTSLNRIHVLEQKWVSILQNVDDHSYSLLCEMIGRTQFNHELISDSLHVCLIGGADDIATPPELMVHLADQLGTALPIIIDKTGHVPSIESPDEMLAIIKPVLVTSKRV